MVSFFGWVCSVTVGLVSLSIASEADFSGAFFSSLSAITSTGLSCSVCCCISRGKPRGKPRGMPRGMPRGGKPRGTPRGNPLPCGKPCVASLIICLGKSRSVDNVSTVDTSCLVECICSFFSMLLFS